VALGGPPGSQLVGPTVVEAALARFQRGAGSAILSGIVGGPCLDVPTRASVGRQHLQSPFPT